MYMPLALPRAGPRSRALVQGLLSMSPPWLVVERVRTRKAAPPALLPPEESLVPDARAGLTPAQMVDRRVLVMLGYVPVR